MTDIAPNVPSISAPTTGTTLDFTTVIAFTWAFSDPDYGDTQSAFDIQYRAVGSGTWLTISQTTTNNFFNAPANTFFANSYEWQLRTYDQSGVPSAWSNSSFFTATTTTLAPTITAPLTGATVNASTVFSWAVATQSGYQIRRVGDLGGSINTSLIYSDTGQVTNSIARSLTLPLTFNATWQWFQIRVFVNGIWSAWTSVRVFVNYSSVLPGTVSINPNQANGSLEITATPATIPATRTNIFPYPSSEDALGLAGNTYAGVNRSCVVSSSTDVATNGSKSLKWLASAGKDLTNKRMFLFANSLATTPIGAGNTYGWSNYVYSPVPITVDLIIEFHNAAGTWLSQDTTSSIAIPAGTWTFIGRSGTTPANTAYIAPAIQESVANTFPFRENLVQNPSGEVDTGGWGNAGASSMVRSTAKSLSGSASTLLTFNGSTFGGVYPQAYSGGARTPVLASTSYVGYCHILDINSAVSYIASIEWYDNTNTFISRTSGNATPVNTSSWTRIAVTGTAPANAVAATVTFYGSSIQSNATQAYFDCMMFTCDSKVNYIQNGSFEIDTLGWNTAVGSSLATLSRVTTGQLSGRACAKVALTGTIADQRLIQMSKPSSTNPEMSAYLPTGTYTLSAKVNGASGQAITAVQATVESIGSGGLAGLTFGATQSATLDGTWHLTYQTFTVTTAGFIVVDINAVGTGVSGNNFLFDEIQIESGSSATAFVDSRYFDGSTGGTDQRWSGTANQSSSIDSPPMYADRMMMVANDPQYGIYFDGSFASDLVNTYSWAGVPNQSQSIMASSLPVATSIDIYVNLTGASGFGTRVATGLPPSTFYVYWAPASGQSYDIRTLTTGANGTQALSATVFTTGIDGGAPSGTTFTKTLDGGSPSSVNSIAEDGGTP